MPIGVLENSRDSVAIRPSTREPDNDIHFSRAGESLHEFRLRGMARLHSFIKIQN